MINIDNRVEEIKLDEITEDFVTKTKKKLADLEDRSRRNNLHFDGFQEKTNETWGESEGIINLEKSRILHNYREKKLWKEKVFVNEDLSEETESIRKGLLQKAKDHRSQSKVAKVVHDRLVYKKERGNVISETQGNP